MPLALILEEGAGELLVSEALGMLRWCVEIQCWWHLFEPYLDVAKWQKWLWGCALLDSYWRRFGQLAEKKFIKKKCEEYWLFVKLSGTLQLLRAIINNEELIEYCLRQCRVNYFVQPSFKRTIYGLYWWLNDYIILY